MKHDQLLSSATTLTALLFTTFAAASCSGGSDDDDSDEFQVRNTTVAVGLSPAIRISGAYLAFLAAEDATGPTGMGGTDLNGDMDMMDAVARVVNTATRVESNVGAAATDMAWADAELYLVVNESDDGNDWNGDTLMDDDVLLHWSETTAMLAYVDDLAVDALDTTVAVLGLGSRIVYAAKTATAGAGGSNLRFVESTDPLVPIEVMTTDTVGPLTAAILGEDEGLVFVLLDEGDAGHALNQDGVQDGDTVLALLAGTSNASVLRSTERAIDPDSPRRAKSVATADWRVGFLVNETQEGMGSLNSAALGASFRACAANDTDILDDVLSVLTYSTWNTDPVANPPINHGLPGQSTIAFAGNYVATIVSEIADNCDLNNDTGMNDTVVRWVAIATSTGSAIVPVNNVSNRVENRALFNTPGGGAGLYELSNRFVIVASEADGGNIDVNPINANLVGWLAPTPSSTVWDFFHGSSGTEVVEASWVSQHESEGRLGVAFTERIGGVSLNQGSAANPGDLDTLDSVPTFASFASSPTRLVFPGILLAVDKDSAAFTIKKGVAFYRRSEPEDSRDTNLDNDELDYIVQVTNYTSGVTFGLSVTTELSERVVEVARFGTARCAAFVADEAQQGSTGTDFNADGDRMDRVLRWFAF